MTIVPTAPRSLETLPFRLRDFTRLAWVSRAAREMWEPRIGRVHRAWSQVETRAVTTGLRDCCLVHASPDQYLNDSPGWLHDGLTALPLTVSGIGQSYASTQVPLEAGKPFAFRFVLGAPARVAEFHGAWRQSDHSVIGGLLGYPSCCTEFFRRVWVDDGLVDTTWQMAYGTEHAHQSGHEIQVTTPTYANVLWRWVGVRAVPHLPCSFVCQATVKLATDLLELGRDLGFAEEMNWIDEIIQWPVEWSALHGIAQIKTPILKVSTRTDATADKYTVQYTGLRSPAGGAKGLNFPFTMPELPILTASTSFRQGIENPIHSNAPQNAPTAGWWAGDNGFDSTGAMIDCHAPLLRLAGSYLRAAGGGRVLDLGCGNGVFLQALCHDNSAIAPFGVDLNAAAIQHAREAVLPEFAANFMQADMFDCDSIWPPGRVYSLAVVMPGRLVEIDADRAARLRQHLSNSCDRILLYAYGDWLTRVGSLAELAAAAGFQVQLDEAIQSPGVSAAFATPQASVPTPTAAFNPRQATHSPVSAAESQSIALSDIDWLRMARPQADQYDTAATLAVARELGHSRPPTQSVLVSASRFFDGAIEIRTGKKTWFGETYGVADRCHPNVQRASELVSVWPEAYAQFKALIHCVYLYTDDTAADDYIVGSTCGAGPDGFGSIAATVNHHVGFGEALVHEMAHHKLRGLGVDFESARRLITNSQESRFPSPIRHDCLRPMTAVVHAQYSYMYIAELDLQIVTMTSERERNRAVVERSLAVIVPKLSFGASVIRANAQTDDAGVRFLQGLFSWYEDLLSRAAQVFRDFAVEPAQFRHPLEAG